MNSGGSENLLDDTRVIHGFRQIQRQPIHFIYHYLRYNPAIITIFAQIAQCQTRAQ